MLPFILLIVVKAASASFNATLSPRDTTCSTPSGIGTCIPTTSCAGTSVPNYCPGASNIQCCVRTCKTPLGSGFCDNTGNTCTGGAYVPNYCPGATDIQCCVASCDTGSAKGSCAWTGSSCGNAFVPNFCPGPDDVQCCPSSVKSSTGGGSSVTKTETVVDSPPAESTGKSLPSSNGNGAAGSTAAGTTSPAHTATTGSPQSALGSEGTPIADANSSAASLDYTGSPSSPTAASKNETPNVKTGGSGNGATDSPSPSGLGTGSNQGSAGSAAPGSGKHISSGAVAGLILGILALAVVAGSAIWIIRKKKTEEQGHQIQEISQGPARVVGQRIGHELDGSSVHEVGQHPSQPPPAYAQELYSREIYEMRGHKQ